MVRIDKDEIETDEDRTTLINSFLIFASSIVELAELSEEETNRLIIASTKMIKHEEVKGLIKEFNKEKLEEFYSELNIKRLCKINTGSL